MKPWKTISRKTILDHSKFLKVEQHRVELPDGRVIDDWPWIITPDYVDVVAIDKNNRFLFFRQIRYALGETSLGIVGGYIEQGEDPLACAKRELLEETGYEAPDWISLGRFAVDSNRGVGTAYLFLAKNAVVSRNHAESDDLEESEFLLLTRQEVEQAVNDGEIKMLAWLTCIVLALRELEKTT